MGKKKIYLLMAAISLLLMVIVFVQFMWVKEVSATEQREANLRVRKVLQGIEQEMLASVKCVELFTKHPLQPGEGFYMIKQPYNSKGFFGTGDTIALFYDYSTFRDSEYKGEVPYFYNSIKASMPITLDIVAQMNFEINDSLFFNRFNHDVKDINRQNFKNIISTSRNISKYFDMHLVDSMIYTAMIREQVNCRYGFGFVQNGKVIYSQRVTDSMLLLKSEHQQPLFMDNRFIPPCTIAIVVAQNNGHTINMWMILGIVALLLLVFCFYSLVKIYLVQNRLSEMKSDFINNLTHEFNTPMANISLAIQTMKGRELQNDKLSKIMGIISSESHRLRDNIDRILQVAAIDKGSVLLRKEDVDLVDIVRAIEPTYQLQCNELGGKLILNVTVETAVIQGDEMHLLNTICNLLDNAIKYRNGRPNIQINLYRQGRYYHIQVADNGKGMDAKTLKYIFEKFYRAHEGFVHTAKGYGIGLNYVKGVVTAHNGKIKVQSKPQKGTRFVISLPKKNN